MMDGRWTSINDVVDVVGSGVGMEVRGEKPFVDWRLLWQQAVLAGATCALQQLSFLNIKKILSHDFPGF